MTASRTRRAAGRTAPCTSASRTPSSRTSSPRSPPAWSGETEGAIYSDRVCRAQSGSSAESVHLDRGVRPIHCRNPTFSRNYVHDLYLDLADCGLPKRCSSATLTCSSCGRTWAPTTRPRIEHRFPDQRREECKSTRRAVCALFASSM